MLKSRVAREAHDLDRKKRGLSDRLSSRVLERFLHLPLNIRAVAREDIREIFGEKKWGKSVKHHCRSGRWQQNFPGFRQHLTWMWHFPSWMGLPHCLGSPCWEVFSLYPLEKGCEHTEVLSVPTAPHAYFQNVKKLNIQCRCNVLGREGLGLGPSSSFGERTALYQWSSLITSRCSPRQPPALQIYVKIKQWEEGYVWDKVTDYAQSAETSFSSNRNFMKFSVVDGCSWLNAIAYLFVKADKDKLLKSLVYKLFCHMSYTLKQKSD